MPPKVQARNLAKKAATAPAAQAKKDKPSKQKMEVSPDFPKVQPKKPSSSYVWFTVEMLKNPTDKLNALNHQEKIKEMGSMWKELSDDQKAVYQKMAEEDKARYERETREMEEQGYFINKDGIKSTDIKPELKDFPKETVMPKKPMAAYFHFQIEKNKEYRAKHPDWKVG